MEHSLSASAASTTSPDVAQRSSLKRTPASEEAETVRQRRLKHFSNPPGDTP
jgi:hypothetical protein